MKLFLDENIAHSIAVRPRQEGHTVILAQQVASGQPDTVILEAARQRDAVVLTEDTDFGELVMHRRLPSAEVVLLRLSGMPRTQQPQHLAQVIDTHEAAPSQAFTLVTRQGVRIRPLPRSPK